MVYQGTCHGTKVAVQTLRNNSERDVFIALLEEIKAMSNLESHNHVVDFAGAYTKEIHLG